MISLPEEFCSNMKQLLKDEYDDYLSSFNENRYYGLRVNTDKISSKDFLSLAPFRLKPISWCSDGFYFEEEDKPAKHPYYYAGLYYLQEPSAMLPAEVLPIEKGDVVLDCCGAPGGKSGRLANKLNNTGLLFANDISISRAQVLLKTLERQGATNIYVSAQDIATLDRFENTFDKILIDAPCSGEGMFRKEPQLIRSWLEHNNDYYAQIQKKIISNALKMLKPGGMMVYSTCTFSQKEDEDIIEYALEICPELKVLPIKKSEGFVEGLTPLTRNCVRLYPHKIKGEGHFVALLQKGDKKEDKVYEEKIIEKPADPFFKDLDYPFHNGHFETRKDKLYFIPDHNIDLTGLRILRSGLLIGEYSHGRFEPSEALAMALKKEEYRKIIDLKNNDERVLKYLKCETLNVEEFDVEGYALVCVDGYPLGFGKVSKGILKNKYPANYRYI